MIGKISILVVLILMIGMLAVAETAIFSVNKNKVKIKAEEGDQKSILLKQTLENPIHCTAAIRLGITLTSLFVGVFTAQTFTKPFSQFFERIGVNASPAVLEPLAAILITMASSYLILVFGELTPKRIGARNANKLARALIQPIRIFTFLTLPFTKILAVSANLVAGLTGFSAAKSDESDVTEEEIRIMMDEGNEKGAIAENELEMIHNIFEFDNTTVGDVCVHRMDIVAVSVDTSYDDVVELLLNEKYSRIPVYEENLDNILGILHTKVMMKYLAAPENEREWNLRELMYAPYVVPFSKKTDMLFREMQKNKVQMAVVVDEYGGTQGIVTMEDLVEEIMGNILDEYDEEEAPEIGKLDENTYLINGTTDLDTVGSYFGIRMPTDDFDTLAGFVIGKLGHIPDEDERPEVEHEGWVFKVKETEEKRIATVLACRIV